MNYQYQTGTRDCFPTCFRNAMLHLGVAVTPVLMKRLEIFKSGTESYTIYDVQERLERYEKSIHKFVAEWNWASGNRNYTGSPHLEPEEWAKYLLDTGVDLELRNGPIEQRKLITSALTKNKIAICEIWIPSTDIPDSECKHDILIVGLSNGKLLIHDPLPANCHTQFDPDKVKFTRNECGSNLEIDCDYFFSNEINYMKPKPNPFQTDYGYKFLLLSRS